MPARLHDRPKTLTTRRCHLRQPLSARWRCPLCKRPPQYFADQPPGGRPCPAMTYITRPTKWFSYQPAYGRKSGSGFHGALHCCPDPSHLVEPEFLAPQSPRKTASILLPSGSSTNADGPRNKHQSHQLQQSRRMVPARPRQQAPSGRLSAVHLLHQLRPSLELASTLSTVPTLLITLLP